MNHGRLLIKHAVGGRTFIDSAKAETEFAVRQEDGDWLLTVKAAPDETVNEILKWQSELNVFVFEEDREPVRKNWFYVKEDGVRYDESAQTLHIAASARLEYIPDEYTW